MSNFEYLLNKKEYELFANACVDAENAISVLRVSPMATRKGLELAIKWVYSADNTMRLPYKDNLSALIFENSFRDAVEKSIWYKLKFVVQLGNNLAHTSVDVTKDKAVLSLSILFEFVQWIEYCYGNGNEYTERQFNPELIPVNTVVQEDTSKYIIDEKDEEIKRLQELLIKQQEQFEVNKNSPKPQRNKPTTTITEEETRKQFIDLDLELFGYELENDCVTEYEVDDMDNVPGQKGFADYVIFGKDGKPLAVIEAKRTSKDPLNGQQQCKLYADCLERKFNVRPLMFCTNGFDTYFWDDLSSPIRQVSSIFSKSDLQKIINRRGKTKDLSTITIDEKITDRYYQKEAIKACCDNFIQGNRKSLLVMATGSGKTRTASSLTDVLSRANMITNVLFLADRTELVRQAKGDFNNYLPHISLCNLLSNKDDKNSRIIFSTYPTILNAISKEKNKDGNLLFTPAHFDLIIVDEAHRSIFKKYKTIFDYFDSLVVGLTATPKMDVDRNTYDFFELENNVPTYAYDYETAVEKDKVLVPYYNIEVKTKFLEEGIEYDKLSDSDKERYEEDFAEEESELPSFIPSAKLNQYIFNQNTVDIVLQDLMENGIKINNGDMIGKTIIFAQNKNHAQYIVDRFNVLYPQYKGELIKRVVCDDSYSTTIIRDFKKVSKMPQITVSVDMLDTGIDVPAIVNLVMFKKVRSKAKFWQMIGRGTRLCPNIEFIDSIDKTYTDKRRFFIFDYCGNFEFFRQEPNGFTSKETKSLTEILFIKRIKLISQIESISDYDSFRESLIDIVYDQITELNQELISVKLQRKYIEKFKDKEIFNNLDYIARDELYTKIAPIVYEKDDDIYAKQFDNFIYGLMLSIIEELKQFKKLKTQLCNVAVDLENKQNMTQVKSKIELIKTIQTDEFWTDLSLLELENVRVELRDLIKFIIVASKHKLIYTELEDVVCETVKNADVDISYDFSDYRLKVNRYIEENKDTTAIWKLRNNEKLTSQDYQDLTDIFTKDLGNKEDYENAYGDTPFGLLIRKIAKLEHEAAMKVFSKFIDEQNLNQNQIVFVNKIINHIVNNGYIESTKQLLSPPFDKPQNFMKLFDDKSRAELVSLIDSVKKNAEIIVA